MTTKSETVLLALFAALSGISGATVERNTSSPERVPAGGLIILRDGTPGAPEVTLSPLVYEYAHQAEIDILVQSSINRDAKFDALKAAVGQALAADRLLGGTCLYVEADSPQPADLSDLGTTAIKAATILVTLIYLTSDPLA